MLWLDPYTPAPACFDKQVRTVNEAISYLKSGTVVHISFAYHLEDGNACDVACALSQLALGESVDRVVWTIHKATPEENAKIRHAMKVAEDAWASRRNSAMTNIMENIDRFTYISCLKNGEPYEC